MRDPAPRARRLATVALASFSAISSMSCGRDVAPPRTSPPQVQGASAAEVAPTPGVDTEVRRHGGVRYGIITIDPRQARIELQGQGEGDARTLGELASRTPFAFATNAGMFHEGERPVGLFVQGSTRHAELEQSAGEGNFYLRPNGVFWIAREGDAHISETDAYAALSPEPRLATQSGPLLVVRGHIHDAFEPGSTSLRIRSGVGVRQDGVVIFAISYEPTRFYDLATLFAEVLECPDALFLDGSISDVIAPGLPRVAEDELRYGGILYVRRRDAGSPG